MIKQLFLVILFGVLSLFVLYVYFDPPNSKKSDFTTAITPSKKKVVIFAETTYFGSDYAQISNSQISHCPAITFCRVTSNSDELYLANAVIYHNRDFSGIMVNSSALQVMVTHESPIHERIRFKPGSINWTMTYRRESEINAPYGSLVKTNKQEVFDFESLWAEKHSTLTAAWMASNCNTGNKRKDLIQKAKHEGLNIHIFGGCGRRIPRCGRYAINQFGCAAKMLSKYKFYFAFENSNCLDYVTEKFWNALKLYRTVPIVIQRQNVENLGVPKNAFIALDDFQTIKQLVLYLNKLKNDKKLYLGFHQWRQHFSAELDNSFGICKLCEKLRKPIIQNHIYQDLVGWYSHRKCNNSYADRYL